LGESLGTPTERTLAALLAATVRARKGLAPLPATLGLPDLPPDALEVLALIAIDEETSKATIARRLDIDEARAVRALRRLRDAGLFDDRVAEAGDRRRVRRVLTADGRRVAEALAGRAGPLLGGESDG